MSLSEPPAAPPKPTASPFWKWVMRVTAIITLLLFLTPAFYVVKYYALDQSREAALARPHSLEWRNDPQNPDNLLAEARIASQPMVKKVYLAQAFRVTAVRELGKTLRLPGIGWRRPVECLSAKASLADLAAHADDPAVKAAAAEELYSLAQHGAVIRR